MVQEGSPELEGVRHRVLVLAEEQIVLEPVIELEREQSVEEWSGGRRRAQLPVVRGLLLERPGIQQPPLRFVEERAEGHVVLSQRTVCVTTEILDGLGFPARTEVRR